jgi:PAS domain-containing protein
MWCAERIRFDRSSKVNTATATDSNDPSASAGYAFKLVWPTTLVAVLASLWLLWYLRVLDTQISRIAWLLTGATGIHVLTAPAMARIRNERVSDIAMLVLHGFSLLLLGAVWLLLGAMDLPLVVLFFAPPVIAAAAARSPWGRASAFTLTLVAVFLAALLASPSLRWYSGQVGLPLSFLDPLAARLASAGAPAEQTVAPRAAAVSLGLAAAAFAALYACASGSIGAIRRTVERLHDSIAALRMGEGLAQELLQSSPLPEALVLPESSRIVLVNDRFRAVFASGHAPTDGARLQEIVRLQFPEAVERLVLSGDGVVNGHYQGPRDRLREVRVHVRRCKHEGARVSRVSFEDSTAERQLEGAMDALDLILLVFDADDALVYANAAARALFAVEPGATAATLLRCADLPESWWRTPAESSVPRQVSIGGTEYRGKVICRTLERLADPLTVIALKPAEPQCES